MPGTMSNQEIDNERCESLVNALFSDDTEQRDSAFQQLMADWRNQLKNAARTKGLDETSAKDAVQEAIMKVWKKIRASEVKQSTTAAFRRYCIVATQHAALDMLSRGNRVRELPDPTAVSWDKEPDDNMIRQEEQAIETQLLAECIEKLRVHNAEYFELAIRKLRAMEVPQIADELQLKPDQVHRRWKSVKDWLATCVQGGVA